MKDLSEKELLGRLNAKIEDQITYEMVTNPAYEVWGRARAWEYHQGICLIAGVAPVSKACFECLLQESSSPELEHLLHHYPIKETDRTRLKNLDKLVMRIPGLSEVKEGKRNISPSLLLSFCEDHWRIGPNIPKDLLSVVHGIGSHDSLNLPNAFSCIEINPAILESRKPLKEIKEKTPIQVFSPTSTPHSSYESLSSLGSTLEIARVMDDPLENQGEEEISKETILTYDLRHLRSDQLTRLLYRLATVQLIEKEKNLKPQQVFKKLSSKTKPVTFLDLIGKGYTEETVKDWIRDLLPGYTSKKTGRKIKKLKK